MIEILLSIIKNKTAVIIAVIVLMVLVIGGIFGFLTYRARKAESEANTRRKENDRLQKQKEGLNIIVNSANSAAEIEKQKEKANAQSQNSNISNLDYINSVRRDSGTFSGNYNRSKSRFCENFPDDGRCPK